MDARDYITSGILELYVMQALSPEEAAEVEDAAARYPEVAAEIEAIRTAVESYTRGLAVTPPAGIREKILQSVKQPKSPEGKKAALPASSPRRYLRIVSMAASLALLVSLLVNYVLYSTNRSLKKDLAKRQDEIKGLNADYDKVYTAYYDLETKMEMMAAPGNKMVHMMGMKNDDVATIVWSPESKEVYLSVNKLTPAPQGKQYQLWAMVDDKPVDLGVFDSGMKTFEMAKMKDIENASAFAVTLENMGGSPVPTMEFLWLMGEVKSS